MGLLSVEVTPKNRAKQRKQRREYLSSGVGGAVGYCDFWSGPPGLLEDSFPYAEAVDSESGKRC
jgi:hypothetical protein